MSLRYAIVGSGAVGLYYGGRMAAAGEDVRFLVRSDEEALRRDGLRVESIAGDFRVAEPRLFRDPHGEEAADVVLVCWKATANDHLAEVLPPLLHSGTRVVTLQNGLGNTERIAGLVGAERVLGGLCFVCLNRVAPGVVRHTGGGLVTIGDYTDCNATLLGELIGTMDRSGIEVRAADDLARAQWVKLVWNVPFNGLCIARGGVDTEALLARKNGEGEVRELMAEVLAAAAAVGHALPETMIDEQIRRTYPMGPYRPSSMIDYVEGREVEVEAIWREPLRRAEAAGADLPAWRKLLGEIDSRLAERDGQG